MSKKNRRNIRNLLIHPDAQLRYGTFFMGISILVHAVTVLVVTQVYSLIKSQMDYGNGLSYSFLVGLVLFIYAALYGFSFMLGLLVSHRLYGPLVAINRAMNKIKDGDYSPRIVLRKNDDEKLKELAETINTLAERLGNKAP